jgi:AraC-like DNA-binding protein
MIADMKKVLTILRIKYNITRLSENFIGLDLDNKKMDSIVKFIQSTIGTVQNFPELAESYLLKSNIQELTVLLLSDLIASVIGAKPIGHKTATLNLVERAEAFIAKECEELFLIEDIANKLNTTPRTLQKSFKKYRDYSPIQFLRIRKLHRAHKLLMEQTPGNFTVKQAALKSGISDLNRFSKNYSKLFGELPSMTIKRSRI